MTDLILTEQERKDSIICNVIIAAVQRVFPATRFPENFIPVYTASLQDVDSIKLAVDADPMAAKFAMAHLFKRVEDTLGINLVDDNMDNITTIGDLRQLVIAATTGKTAAELSKAIEDHKRKGFRVLLQQKRAERVNAA